MPLIACPDCAREVSDVAPACVGCGRPIAAAAPARVETDANTLIVVGSCLAIGGTVAGIYELAHGLSVMLGVFAFALGVACFVAGRLF